MAQARGDLVFGEPFFRNLPTLRDRPGVVAVEVRADSPAERAGVQVQDSIVRINDIEVDHPAHLYALRMGLIRGRANRSLRSGAKERSSRCR